MNEDQLISYFEDHARYHHKFGGKYYIVFKNKHIIEKDPKMVLDKMREINQEER